RLPFRLGPVVAFSPPVSMQSTAQILDSYYERDFGAYHFDLLKLVRLRDRSIAGPGSPSPFEPRLMRAGIGYLFHKAIKRAVETNDAQYCLGLLDWYKRTGHRRSDPGEWTFIRFVEEMSWPYWRQQGVSQSLEEYWTMGDLAPLLPVVGDDVFVYLSIDDPLDDPGDVIRLQKKFKPPLFNVLPYGGHLGYATSEWVRKIVLYRLGSPPCLCNVPAPALARSLGSSH
ncbi:MAG TPA: hypothetical protein VFY29_19035, partial [Terriglobia bacterium]|nr:hypothetical protein [Terriglobia bacterium]